LVGGERVGASSQKQVPPLRSLRSGRNDKGLLGWAAGSNDILI
jgi:hypothetical protein